MKNCKYCKSEIDSKAKVCPNCRKKQGLPLGKLIIVLIFVLLLGSCFMSGEEENIKTIYNLGESFESDYIKLTMTSVNDDFKNYEDYAEVKDGYKIVEATFEMVSNEGDNLLSYVDFNCYADDVAYEQFYSVDDSAFSHSLTEGKKASGSIYCEVPSDSQNIVVSYDVNFWTEENLEFIVK